MRRAGWMALLVGAAAVVVTALLVVLPGDRGGDDEPRPVLPGRSTGAGAADASTRGPEPSPAHEASGTTATSGGSRTTGPSPPSAVPGRGAADHAASDEARTRRADTGGRARPAGSSRTARELEPRWEAAVERAEAEHPLVEETDPVRRRRVMRVRQHDIQASIRETLGPEDYDRYRHATGQPNRVAIQRVPEGSLAEELGLQPGDVVLEIDHEPLYTVDEYKDRVIWATDVGEVIPLTIERDGEQFTVFSPQGMLNAPIEGVIASPR